MVIVILWNQEVSRVKIDDADDNAPEGKLCKYNTTIIRKVLVGPLWHSVL